VVTPGQVVAGEAPGRLLHSLGRALEDDLSAPFARPGPDLDHLVGRPDHRLLMLDHHHGVAAVAELDDSLDEAVDVARVQPDGRLVEHVEHVDEAGAQRRGKHHAADLAAAEGAHGAVQGQIPQSYCFQIGQPGADLIEHHAAHLTLPVGQLQIAEERCCLLDLHGRELGDALAADSGEE